MKILRLQLRGFTKSMIKALKKRLFIFEMKLCNKSLNFVAYIKSVATMNVDIAFNLCIFLNKKYFF